MRPAVLILRSTIFLLIFNSLFSLAVYGQTISNTGHDFWATFPTHVQDVDPMGNPLPANFSLFITAAQSSSGIVTIAGGIKHFTVSANSVTEIPIPRNGIYINENESGQVLAGRAIHVQTDAGQPPIVAYAHVFAGHRSAATLLLPKEALGQSYYSINFKQHDTEGKNFLVVTAAEPDTKIHLTRGNSELVNGGIYLARAGDSYEYLSTDDLTGVAVSVDRVTSACKHIAVFSGSSGIYISPPNCAPASLDPLYQQCFPIESWGYHYGFIPFSTSSPEFSQPVRTSGQYLRVMARDADTHVKINGKVVATLGSGEYYTTPVPLTQAANVEADRPVCVAQYALSQSCSGGKGYSDPDMVILNPMEYKISDITVYSSTRENIREQYLNILISSAAAASFKINGVAPLQLFQPFSGMPGYCYLQLRLDKQATNIFHLTADDGFNAIAYGFGDVESYAYSAGTNLSGIQSLQAYNTNTNLPIDSACPDGLYFFKLTLPYKSPFISWQMDDNELPTKQISPPFQLVYHNGAPAYEYRFPKTPAYRQSGQHQIHIVSDYPTTLGGCENGKQEIHGDFYVFPSPIAVFTDAATPCYNTIGFKDKTEKNGTEIADRLWDFGDPKSSAADNMSRLPEPFHSFSLAGKYIVRLTVFSVSGCQSTVSREIIIAPHATPKFTTSQPGCSKEPVFFTDQSTDEGFGISSRKWLFGDGDSLVTSSTKPITHTFSKGGAYKTKLVLINNQGCETNPVSTDIEIRDKVKAAFLIPSVCTAAPDAQFANLSIDTDYPGRHVSYEWNFGDQQAGPGNPNWSSGYNGVHSYYRAGDYVVTLVALTDECRDTLQQKITVNSSAPTAAFKIISSAQTCAGQPVILQDLSAMPTPGEKINTLTWYFDALGDRKNVLTITNPQARGKYQIVYPSFYGKSDRKVYTLRLLAFSGADCVDSVSNEVVITALPEPFFTAIPEICISSAPVQIVNAGEVNGRAGIGKFTGDGITEDGIFTPAVTGTGSHKITYSFVNTGGCEAIRTQFVNVISSPEITISGDLYINEGQSIKLQPLYSGEHLQYHWTPQTGLDRTDVPYPIAAPTETTSYAITIAAGGCTETKTLKVFVKRRPVVINAFTPNGDGRNDYWEIKHIEDYPENTVNIFNRYGMLIFHSSGYGKPWDGKYKGSPVPAATYYYVINLSPNQQTLSGYLTVLY